jgi:hypothetical protein
MSRFIEGQVRSNVALLPECLHDFIAYDNPVRAVDAFIGELDMVALGFDGATPATTGRPTYHPGIMLKVNDMATSTASSPAAGWSASARACALGFTFCPVSMPVWPATPSRVR